MNMDDNFMDFEEPEAVEEEQKNNKTKIIIIAAVAVVLCCCCAFLISGYFVWGDPLAEMLGLI